MKRIYFMFLLLFGISNYSFGKVKFENAIGLLRDRLTCVYRIDGQGDVFCDQKYRVKQKFPIKGVNDIKKAVVKRSRFELDEMIVYNFKDGYYKLAYIWDTVKNTSVVFDHVKNPNLDDLTLPLYMKSFLKDTYEVRYFWFKPIKPYSESKRPNEFISLGDGLKTFNFTSEHNVRIFGKPNGNVNGVILGEKIKSFKIDFSHAKGKELGPNSTEPYMVMKAKVLDSRIVKDELWLKVKIPLTQSYDELDRVYVKEHGYLPSPITFKQSIFNEEKIGWIKVFDKDGFFVFR